MRTKSEHKKNLTISPGKKINLARFIPVRRKILVLDDDLTVRDVFRIIFEDAGYDVEMEKDGKQILRNNFSTPDLFLIDKLLAGVNGLDVCRHLKRQKSTRHIPIVMVSASPGIGLQSKAAGAEDYVEKPFDRHYLLEVVKRNLTELH